MRGKRDASHIRIGGTGKDGPAKTGRFDGLGAGTTMVLYLVMGMATSAVWFYEDFGCIARNISDRGRR